MVEAGWLKMVSPTVISVPSSRGPWMILHVAIVQQACLGLFTMSKEQKRASLNVQAFLKSLLVLYFLIFY